MILPSLKALIESEINDCPQIQREKYDFQNRSPRFLIIYLNCLFYQAIETGEYKKASEFNEKYDYVNSHCITLPFMDGYSNYQYP